MLSLNFTNRLEMKSDLFARFIENLLQKFGVWTTPADQTRARTMIAVSKRRNRVFNDPERYGCTVTVHNKFSRAQAKKRKIPRKNSRSLSLLANDLIRPSDRPNDSKRTLFRELGTSTVRFTVHGKMLTMSYAGDDDTFLASAITR